MRRVKVENKTVALRITIPMFIIVGGLVTLVYELRFGNSFDVTNSWKMFLIGFGWQAIIKNYVPSEKAPPKGEPTKDQAIADKLEAIKTEGDQEAKEYTKRLKGAKKRPTG